MSHLAVAGCAIENVDLDLFKKTLAVVAEKFGGKIGDSVDGYDEGKNVKTWGGKKILASIRTKNLPQGIGFVLEKGKLTFVCDKLCDAETVTHLNRGDSRWGPLEKKSAKEFGDLKDAIEKTYILLGVAESLEEMGSDNITSSENSDNGDYLIQGEFA